VVGLGFFEILVYPSGESIELLNHFGHGGKAGLDYLG
jgi:hypothetical protein